MIGYSRSITADIKLRTFMKTMLLDACFESFFIVSGSSLWVALRVELWYFQHHAHWTVVSAHHLRHYECLGD